MLVVSSVKLTQTVPSLLSFTEVQLLKRQCDGSQEHVLLELTVVADGGLQCSTFDHLQRNSVFQHFHETWIAVFPHNFSFSLSHFCWIRM